MSQLQQLQASPRPDDQDRFLHLKEIIVDFAERRPNSDLRIKFKDNSGFETKSDVFKKADSIHWKADIYVKCSTEAVLTIRNGFFNNSIAEIPLTFNPDEFGEDKTVERKDTKSGASVYMIFAMSKSSVDVAHLLGTQACSALAAKVSMLDKLDKVLDFLDIVKLGGSAAEVNTHAKIAVGVVSQAVAKFREIPTCHKQLVAIMNDLVSILPVMMAALERIQETECRELLYSFVSFVKETSEGLIRYASRSTTVLILQEWYKSKKDDVGRLKDQSMRLKQNLDLALSIDIQKATSEIQGSTSEIRNSTLEIQKSTSELSQQQFKDADEKLLERIKPKFSSFDPRHCCMPGTRETLLRNIESLALSDNQTSRLYWLFGIAGSGKSSVALSVVFALRNQARLTGSFFCKRDIPELRNPVRLIHTLAYSIARVYISYRNILLGVLKGDPQIEYDALPLQFEALLAGPFQKVSQDPPHESIIIVIDALDECDDNKTLSLFLAQMILLAPWLRLIVTSRPLPDIEKGLQRLEGLVTYCDLFTQNADGDILSFIRWQISPQGPLMELQAYVTDIQIWALGRKSFGLFIWIATVMSYVSGLIFGKLDAIEDMVCSGNASDPEAELDALYLRVLHSVAGSSAANKKAVKLIVGLIYVTSRNRSLPAKALHAFISGAGIRVLPQELEGVLRQLGSIITADSQTDAIRVCHPSFLDFIGSKTRSRDFWMKTSELDAIMSKQCFEIMEAGLKFNICGLESSYIGNVDVVDLEERVARCIPRELQYSCFYWLDHLSKSEDQCKREMGDILHRFLCESKLLYWLEALSLMSELKAANTILQKLQSVYKVGDNGRNRLELYLTSRVAHTQDDAKFCNATLDFYRFVTGLHEPMSRSTPHIYVSALFWAPSESMVIKAHGCKFKNSQQVLAGRNASWPVSLQTILTESSVSCVQYSPNGSRIISGSSDYTIRMWDAASGGPVGEPLRGHTSRVRSVEYSPDGSRIISGSYDSTVRMWDAESGAPVGETLRGHTGGVNSVGYSPDGSRIISGSDDSTIRMWDAHSGGPVGEPLRGHTDRVLSVRYSPDGTRIISGSYDKTIRMWDAESGAPVGEPLRGHTGRVLSVGYSPDGSRIISGSFDRTILMWDAESGAPIGEPLRGHTGWVLSVGYSPDGTRIISGSSDKTICIWDAESGAPVGEPLRGHTDGVSSVGYLSDGTRIISGSSDYTIRMWDAASGAPVGEPLRGHTGVVLSVGYSPDGTRIISGSSDKTIRMWDAHSGAPIGEPLRGHTGWVYSVVCSPDGTRIISGSFDKTVRIWDAQSGAPVGKLPQGGIHWSPGDECFVSITETNASDEETRVAFSSIPSIIPLDGWIRTLDGGLLLWVPHEYRNGVCDMSLACMPYNAVGHPVRIDWKSLYHVWTELRDEEKA